MTERFPVGTVFYKNFQDPETGEWNLYRGQIKALELVETNNGQEENQYFVVYDDGDEEHIAEVELEKLVASDEEQQDFSEEEEDSTFQRRKRKRTVNGGRATASLDDDDEEDEVQTETTHRHSSENGNAKYKNKRGRFAKKVNYNDAIDENEFCDSDVSLEQTESNSRKKEAMEARNNLSKKKRASDSDDAFTVDSSEDDADTSDDELILVDSDDESISSVEEKKRAGRRAKSKSARDTATKSGGGAKKKMSESFQPLNAPTYPKDSLEKIRQEKDYLDPCGMEATDDIIGRLVGEQVDKIAGLLQRALSNPNNIGSLSNALKLGTACSGTDAPALALTLVQEQMELRGMSCFNHSHEFSCENDPFKQAYLARNFDSGK